MNQEGERRIKSFTDLNAWQEGHKLVIMVYALTKTFPANETYGLISQMQRCAVSITSNLAEGFSRQSYREKVQFYSISQGSVTELQNQLLVARDIGHVVQSQFDPLANQAVTVHKLISGLIKSSKSFVRP